MIQAFSVCGSLARISSCSIRFLVLSMWETLLLSALINMHFILLYVIILCKYYILHISMYYILYIVFYCHVEPHWTSHWLCSVWSCLCKSITLLHTSAVWAAPRWSCGRAQWLRGTAQARSVSMRPSLGSSTQRSTRTPGGSTPWTSPLSLDWWGRVSDGSS